MCKYVIYLTYYINRLHNICIILENVQRNTKIYFKA